MFEKEVAKGSAWLDRMNPGWYKSIDLRTFSLASYDTCSLGQTLGTNVSIHLCDDSDFSLSHGFKIPNTPQVKEQKKTIFGTRVRIDTEATTKRHEATYSLLTSTWIQEILRRRESDRMRCEAIKNADTKNVS